MATYSIGKGTEKQTQVDQPPRRGREVVLVDIEIRCWGDKSAKLVVMRMGNLFVCCECVKGYCNLYHARKGLVNTAARIDLGSLPQLVI
jgi:hypothetical protein